MSIDIIVFAVIAVLLLARLWFVLGRRNEEDRQRPNPFTILAPPAQDKTEDAAFANTTRPKGTLAPPPVFLAPASLAGGLEEVGKIDASFNEKEFLQKARDIFTATIAAFAKGDLSPVAPMLAAPVLARFGEAVDARKKANETMECDLKRIADAEVTAAKVETARAILTVRFVSDQEIVLRDANGQVIGGEPGKIEEVTDVWVFAKEAKDGALWTLIETKS